MPSTVILVQTIWIGRMVIRISRTTDRTGRRMYNITQTLAHVQSSVRSPPHSPFALALLEIALTRICAGLLFFCTTFDENWSWPESALTERP